MQIGDTARQKPRSVLKKKDKLRIRVVKSISLRIISPAFVVLGLVQEGYQADVRGCERWRSGNTQQSGGLNTWVLHGVIRGLSGGLVYVQMYV